MMHSWGNIIYVPNQGMLTNQIILFFNRVKGGRAWVVEWNSSDADKSNHSLQLNRRKG